jgi:Raf kinase inhibitor-like YbhB/YbcL family protein
MRTLIVSACAAVLALALGTAHADVGQLSVTSSAFAPQGKIPAEYSCDGRSTMPPLSWSATPPGTRSFVVIVDDPDAPGGTFEHLVLYNLPPTQRSLPTEAVQSIRPGSALAAATNSAGTVGWAPICPPSGQHHYRFIVLALDSVLPLRPSATSADVQKAMTNHILARGELTGTYQRMLR